MGPMNIRDSISIIVNDPTLKQASDRILIRVNKEVQVLIVDQVCDQIKNHIFATCLQTT